METTIRPYQKNDKEACLNAFKSNVPLFFTEQEINDYALFLDNYPLQSMHEHPHRKTYYFVVVFQDKIIGCGGFGDKENTNHITLAWGLIHRDFHKKGFGEKLLAYRLAQIKNLYPEAPVFIDTTQYSYPFFEKFGFITTKMTHDFYALGMHRYDMILAST